MKSAKFIFLSVLFVIILTGFVQACHCGDNSVNVLGEECDGSDLQDKTCFDFGFDAGELSCEDCLYDTSNCYDFECGDGVKEGDEECDDGNLIEGDGCSSECLIETPKIIPSIEPEEPTCEDNLKVCVQIVNYSIINSLVITCETEDIIISKEMVNFGGLEYCSTLSNKTLGVKDELRVDCKITLETENFIVEEEISSEYNCPLCGDEIVEGKETCDEGTLNGVLCSAGYKDYCEYCTSECEIEKVVGPYCGDGELNPDFEECDDGNLIDGDLCSSECLIEPSVCGNSVIEKNETCDSGTLNGILCSAGYESYCEYCSSECQIETAIGPYCGDGVCQTNENYNSCSSDCDKERKDDEERIENYYFQEICISNWECSPWGPCEERIKTRECYDKNTCPFSSTKPSEIMICEIFESSKVEDEENNLLFILAILSSFFLLTYLALFTFYKLK